MQAVPVDLGYSDRVRGYYDIRGLGVAADYCRYVGDSPNIWASCKLAGTDNEYTPRGVVDVQQNTFVLKKVRIPRKTSGTKNQTETSRNITKHDGT